MWRLNLSSFIRIAAWILVTLFSDVTASVHVGGVKFHKVDDVSPIQAAEVTSYMEPIKTRCALGCSMSDTCHGFIYETQTGNHNCSLVTTSSQNTTFLLYADTTIGKSFYRKVSDRPATILHLTVTYHNFTDAPGVCAMDLPGSHVFDIQDPEEITAMQIGLPPTVIPGNMKWTSGKRVGLTDEFVFETSGAVAPPWWGMPYSADAPGVEDCLVLRASTTLVYYYMFGTMPCSRSYYIVCEINL